MIRFMMAASLSALLVSGPATMVVAESQDSQSNAHRVIAQLVLRDRRITIASAPDGYLYSIADKSGIILSANLTETQLAQQYPELFDLLQPAIADEDEKLLMLAPRMN